MKIPEAALQRHVAVLGKNGSGKTFAVKGIVEHLLEQHRRVCIVDPTGAWWGLRSSRDGKGAGFPILVLGGDHGDLPLPALGGAAVARLVAEQGVNLIADTSQLTVGERTRWFIDFAGTLYRANRTPLHLVLDEAHNFMPQGKVFDPDAGKMLHAANVLASQGRSRGLRVWMITQRPQKLHKDSLTTADTLIAMRVLHALDRGAVQEWVNGCGDPAQGKQVLDSLASLATGEGWVWYPEGSFLQRMKFPPIKTFDSSATPTDGAAIAAPKAAAEIDLTEVRAALADAVKDAEANDPKLLRAEIARLKKEADKPRELAVDVNALDRAWAQGHASGKATGYRACYEAIETRLRTLQTGLLDLVDAIELEAKSRPDPKVTAPRAPAAPARAQPAPQPQPTQPSDLSGPLQRVLDALAELAALGVPQPERVQVAFLAGYSNLNSKGFTNALGAARSGGLVDYPSAGRLTLTAKGRGQARATNAPQSQDELHRRILSLLGGAHERLLRPLITAYPDALARESLADAAGYTNLNSKGFTNAIGRLRSLGFIDYPGPGLVVAQPVLFLP